MILDPQLESIGIFDSGVGGLTVMRAIRLLMPRENILYFGDTAHLPYGNKSAETILRHSLESAVFLETQGIKVLVIACNTSCCAALSEVRKALSIPVIGITEQGVEEVVQCHAKERVAILGTKATIASGMFQQHIIAKSPSLELFPIACPLFVPLIEEGYAGHPLSTPIVEEALLPLKNKGIDTALLGCTHYPLLRPLIQEALGLQVTLIDPAFACAERTRQVLAENNLLNPSTTIPRYQFFVSDDPERFRLLGKTFLNDSLENVKRVQ